jgi:hypothetical protein
MKKRWFLSRCALAGLAFIASAASTSSGPLYAQQQPAGVVTAVQGKAQLTRPTVPTPSPLRYKDVVFIRDTINTGEKSLARVLFGGKATVTIRELTRFEVREEILPTGGTRSTIDLASGAILINVARELMRPGDEVLIRTPNAVAAVGGSSLFIQSITELAQSIFTQLSGSATIGCLPPATCPHTPLTQNTAVDFIGAGVNVQGSAIRTILQEHVNQILQWSQVGKAITAEANRNHIAQTELQQAAALDDAAVELATDEQAGGGPTRLHDNWIYPRLRVHRHTPVHHGPADPPGGHGGNPGHGHGHR